MSTRSRCEEERHLLGARKRADECTDTHQTDHRTLDDRYPFGLASLSVCAGREPVDKVAEEQHGRDLPSVISEEEAADGSDCAEENRFDTAVSAIDADGPGVSALAIV